MPSPRTDALRVVAIAADVLALAVLWALAIRARLWVGDAWPFDWFPAVEVLKAVDPDAALRKGFLVVPLTAAVLGWRGRWSGRRRADVDIARTIVDVAIALALVQALFFLAALPGPMQGMARQAAQKIAQETDGAKLKEGLAQLEAQAAQVPPQMAPVMDYLKKKMQERIGQLEGGK